MAWKNRRPRGGAAAVAAVAVLLVFSSAAPPEDTVLFRIERADLDRLSADAAAGLFVVQELQTCLLASGPAALPGELAEAGVPAVVLDGKAEGKIYFLVRTPRPEEGDILVGLGTAVPLEERVWLFSPASGDPREIIPPAFRLKRLDLDRSVVWSRGAPAGETAAGAVEAVVPDPRIFEWVARVSKSKLTETIQSLQNFQTRYASTAACENAGTFLYNRFVQLGLACEYETFTFSWAQRQSRNIIATLPGKAVPNRVVIVCAHYDSISDEPETLAPGADDNASGTAAVLEIARVLAAAPLDYTVKFICFSAEEWGLYGSSFYAQRAKSRGERIVGVINMDMISYTDSDDPLLEVYVNPASRWLADQYLEAAEIYAPLAASKITDSSATWSDHSPFWDQGFAALCAIEESAGRNPYYHETTDTLDKLNMNYCTSVTRASLASAADLARPHVVRPAPPTGLQARSEIISSLFAAVKSVSLAWDAGPASVAGYNVYRTTTSGGGHVKINSRLLSEPRFSETMLDPATTYFYEVTAVDGQGLESDGSDEVRDDQNNDALPN
ncbi:MAG: M20/M25/M40 family metallo-hydrolase [Acidobacteriota bacterium]|nr:M20/M25/M40 family metallo-hydrolase [Acidobacteriota bacterium]